MQQPHAEEPFNSIMQPSAPRLLGAVSYDSMQVHVPVHVLCDTLHSHGIWDYQSFVYDPSLLDENVRVHVPVRVLCDTQYSHGVWGYQTSVVDPPPPYDGEGYIPLPPPYGAPGKTLRSVCAHGMRSPALIWVYAAGPSCDPGSGARGYPSSTRSRAGQLCFLPW